MRPNERYEREERDEVARENREWSEEQSREVTADLFTATATREGRKIRYTVIVSEDGPELNNTGGRECSILSTVEDYAFVHIQQWESGDAWAPRFSRRPKAVGAKIEYGRCVACVAIDRSLLKSVAEE